MKLRYFTVLLGYEDILWELLSVTVTEGQNRVKERVSYVMRL